MGIVRNYLLVGVAMFRESVAKGRGISLWKLKPLIDSAAWELEQFVHLKYFILSFSNITFLTLFLFSCVYVFCLKVLQFITNLKEFFPLFVIREKILSLFKN